MPVVELAVQASADDVAVAAAEDSVYPPTTTPTVAESSTTIAVDKGLLAINYKVGVALMQWDTRALPGNAQLTDVTLRLNLAVAAVTADSRSLMAEWYPTAWPIDITAWTDSAVGDAHAGTPLSTFTTANTNYDLALADLGKVNLNGFTGIRLHISGDIPTGENLFIFNAFDHASAAPPRLILTYDTVEDEGNPGTRYKQKRTSEYG